MIILRKLFLIVNASACEILHLQKKLTCKMHFVVRNFETRHFMRQMKVDLFIFCHFFHNEFEKKDIEKYPCQLLVALS